MSRFTRVAIGFFVLATAGAGWVYTASERALEKRHPVTPSPSLTGARLDGDLERGRHLVTVLAQCTHCHGPDLAGAPLADDPFIGRLHASNLTRGQGGVGAVLSDAEWIAALRQGVSLSGRSLLLMPAAGLAALTDADLAAIVAYVRQVPPVDRVVPARRAGWLTRLAIATGRASGLIAAEEVARRETPTIGGSNARVRFAANAEGEARATTAANAETAPHSTAQATAEYGEYLVALGSCRVCHLEDLTGGLHPLSLPGEPVPPDLTRLADWTLGDFARAMREGRTPDGRTLDRAFMPWPAFAGLSDHEVASLWAYLESLERGSEDEALRTAAR